ncbi:hypothetical protein [Pseudomonas borbori]|uniref:hypothetical protein n=1 Tax=Pseudomonas borbori TaxID=289003 RepID=UPI000B84BA61|nr:hypothetical protein [Pseudomonas borbori]
MGDWEDTFGAAGMSADFAPWDSPCWNDDWEHELRAIGYLTLKEWNASGRVIKAGEKGTFLPCAKLMVFSESQTELSQNTHNPRQNASSYFDDFSEALDWAKRNPGKSITRSPDGKGFIAK